MKHLIIFLSIIAHVYLLNTYTEDDDNGLASENMVSNMENKISVEQLSKLINRNGGKLNDLENKLNGVNDRLTDMDDKIAGNINDRLTFLERRLNEMFLHNPKNQLYLYMDYDLKGETQFFAFDRNCRDLSSLLSARSLFTESCVTLCDRRHCSGNCRNFSISGNITSPLSEVYSYKACL